MSEENNLVYEYESGNDPFEGMTEEEMAAQLAAEELAEKQGKAAGKIISFMKRKSKSQKIRRAANFARKVAQRKTAYVGLRKARATQQYNKAQNVAVQPIDPDLLNDAQDDPAYLQMLLNSHQESVQGAKAQALQAYKDVQLAAYRTSTNESAANAIRQLPTIAKTSRAAYILHARLDDLFGKLDRNLKIAATNAERDAIAKKMFDVDQLRNKTLKVISRFETYRSVPPGLEAQAERLLAGENVAGVLAPTLPVANRLPAAFANLNTRKNARYNALQNQMLSMPVFSPANMMAGREDARMKLINLAALEDILDIIKAQPVENNAQQATIDAEIAKIQGLKAKVEASLASKTPLNAADKSEIDTQIEEYKLRKKNKSTSMYRRLVNDFARSFQLRKIGKELSEKRGAPAPRAPAANTAANTMVPMIPVPAPLQPQGQMIGGPGAAVVPLTAAELRAQRLAKLSGAKPASGMGGKRKTRRTKRKN